MKKSKLVSKKGRRAFIQKSSLIAFQLALGTKIVFAKNLTEDFIPVSLIGSDPITGKNAKLTLLNDRPVNAETPAHLLLDDRTPNDLFFVRNNGTPPPVKTIDISKWKLTIDGESVQKEVSFSIADLKRLFKEVSLDITLECGGNGRSEFIPAAKGNQWTVGAVGCATFTGVRLRDVLNYVGVKSDAVYIGYHAADSHLSGAEGKEPISRGVPIEKALQAESLIAWSMNGEDLPWHNGYPLRLVFGGWPASCSGKWLTGISIRNKIHDGPKMESPSYRVPCEPAAPGSEVDEATMCIIESMPVKSIITYPKSGAILTKKSPKLSIKGHAWAGENVVSKVFWSIDFGATWESCTLSKPVNKYAWQHFEAEINFPQKGYYEVWARAQDDEGRSQPMIVPGWNPKGYLNNACHRIAVKVV